VTQRELPLLVGQRKKEERKKENKATRKGRRINLAMVEKRKERKQAEIADESYMDSLICFFWPEKNKKEKGGVGQIFGHADRFFGSSPWGGKGTDAARQVFRQ